MIHSKSFCSIESCELDFSADHFVHAFTDAFIFRIFTYCASDYSQTNTIMTHVPLIHKWNHRYFYVYFLTVYLTWLYYMIVALQYFGRQIGRIEFLPTIQIKHFPRFTDYRTFSQFSSTDIPMWMPEINDFWIKHRKQAILRHFHIKCPHIDDSRLTNDE